MSIISVLAERDAETFARQVLIQNSIFSSVKSLFKRKTYAPLGSPKEVEYAKKVKRREFLEKVAKTLAYGSPMIAAAAFDPKMKKPPIPLPKPPPFRLKPLK